MAEVCASLQHVVVIPVDFQTTAISPGIGPRSWTPVYTQPLPVPACLCQSEAPVSSSCRSDLYTQHLRRGTVFSLSFPAPNSVLAVSIVHFPMAELSLSPLLFF